MTEIKKIKISFTKKSIKDIPAKDMNAGSKGVELEIQTNFLMSQICSLDKVAGGPVADGSFEKIAFVFKDDAEKVYYDALLNSKNQTFELSFDKEKVFLDVFGFANFIDETKPEVQVSPGHKSMVVFFDSKFTGIITLESKNNKDNPNKDNPPNVSVVRNYCKSNDIKNLTYDEETDKLIIEYKQDKPTKELTDLSGELDEIKRYLLKKGKANGKKRSLIEADWEDKSQTQVQKTDYTPWLIGGGILVFIIVILALVGMAKSNKD